MIGSCIVPLQVSDYSQLSDYNVELQLCRLIYGKIQQFMHQSHLKKLQLL